MLGDSLSIVLHILYYIPLHALDIGGQGGAVPHLPSIEGSVLGGIAQESSSVHELLRNTTDIDAGPAQAPLCSLG